MQTEAVAGKKSSLLEGFRPWLVWMAREAFQDADSQQQAKVRASNEEATPRMSLPRLAARSRSQGRGCGVLALRFFALLAGTGGTRD